MCGIVGLFPYPLKTEDDKINNVAKSVIHRLLFSETLVALEPRGKDSSGIALLWNDKKTAVLKQPIPSPVFVRDDGGWTDHVDPNNPDVNFKWLMSLWNRGVNTDHQLRAALGHVRKGTKGSPYNNHNNHPIIVPPSGKLDENDLLPEGTIVGIHNGGIQNDAKLFKSRNLEQIGEVDSEVIFQLMREYKDDISIDNLKKTFEDLEGAFAVMAYNNAIPNKIGCIREVRPMEAAYFPALGSLVVVSERKYLDEAWVHYDRWRVREADMDLYFTNESGVAENIGKVGDLCPYLRYHWYGGETTAYNASSVESGVFVLDLDTEVDSKTKPEDLIKVTKLVKKATGTSYQGGNFGGHRSVYNAPKANDKRSVSDAKKDKDKKTGTEVVDTTDYSVDKKAIDAEATEVETDESEEGVTTSIEIDAIESGDEDEETNCPYEWDELIDYGKRSLYKQEMQENDNLLLNKPSDTIQSSMEKHLVKSKDENSAGSMLACMYDLIFPEGYAHGYLEGYEQAAIEYTTMMEGEPNNSDMEDKLNTAYSRMKVIQEKKDNATRLLTVFGPMLSMFLANEDVFKEDGDVNVLKLRALMRKAGIKSPDVWSTQVAKSLAKKKA